VSVYLDISVVLPMIVEETTTARVETWLTGNPELRISTWTVAEVSSALSFRVRSGRMDKQERHAAEQAFDDWRRDGVVHLSVSDSDLQLARRLLQTHLTLRAPDAVHLALAQQGGHSLATYDRTLAEVARRTGVEVIAP